MKTTTRKNSNPSASEKGSHRSSSPSLPGGFAIVATISLVILLVMIAVGLLSLTTVTLRSAGHDLARSEARANAKMALILALGDLQKNLGPDQRISARAETLAQDSRVGATVLPSSAKSWWVGATSSDVNESIGVNNQPVVWLISGLDLDASSAAQIDSAAFDSPVTMYGENTIDVSQLTGGEEIQAGKVLVSNSDQEASGGFAYFIDDEGMKAQLAASNVLARNDGSVPAGGGVLPATYELDELEGMEGISGTPLEDYQRLNSINDLPFFGLDQKIAREKRFSYTAKSRGVLTDVKKGGLKRDLTIAFENDTVFENVLSNNATGGGFAERYLVMDPDKLSQAAELSANGYIHWDIFKDYYNLKKYLRKIGTTVALDPIQFGKDGITTAGTNNTPFGRGQLGPHQIGPNASVPASHQNMPYGDFNIFTSLPGSNTVNYKHNPIGPILSRIQQSAWMSIGSPTASGASQIRTHSQLFTSHYNPYNVALNMQGDGPTTGPRILKYPQIRFTYGSSINKVDGLGTALESHVPNQVVIGPGRSQVFGFKQNREGASEGDQERLYGDNVKDLVLESVFQNIEVASPPTGSESLQVEFVLTQPAMGHGVDHKADGFELSQAFWAPIAWDAIGTSTPGKKLSKNVSPAELNENVFFSHAFSLRTTRESSIPIRPLVDSNIRAIFNNPKWDSPLGLSTLAGYSSENNGEVKVRIPSLSTVDQPFGYSFMGADDKAGKGSDQVVLFDIPREDLVSLGQLQHASAGRFSYEPTYIVGSSYANVRIPGGDWRNSINDTFSKASRGLTGFAIPGKFNIYDASYLVNEELWDSYIFTTIPQKADNFAGSLSPDPAPSQQVFQGLLDGDVQLPNPRFLPYEPEGSQFNLATLQEVGNSGGTTGSFFHNAGHLMVDGVFNINSTSIDAWEAFLSGVSGSPYVKLGPEGQITGFDPVDSTAQVRFPRTTSTLGSSNKKSSLDENFWTGFRGLEQSEVRLLAEEIVEEVKLRGPFLSLGEFVNRKLESGSQGQRGALQAALDRTVNEGISGDFENSALGGSIIPSDSSQGAGFPGQLLQGDVLQALSPYMSPRSDTFRIRAYGESRNPRTGEVESSAWCEAVVQRVPDPMSSELQGGGDLLVELSNPTSRFGRKFQINSFRWLSSSEI